MADKYGIPEDEARLVCMGEKEEDAIRIALASPPRVAKPGSLVPRPGTLLGSPIEGSGITERTPVWNGLLPLLREKAKLLFLLNLRRTPALPVEVLWKIVAYFECPVVPYKHQDSLCWRHMYNDHVRDGLVVDRDRPVPLGAGRYIHVDTVREEYDECVGGWPTHPAPFWCAHDGMLDYPGYRVFLWNVSNVRYPGSIAVAMPLDHCPTGYRENPAEWFGSDNYRRFRADRAREVYGETRKSLRGRALSEVGEAASVVWNGIVRLLFGCCSAHTGEGWDAVLAGHRCLPPTQHPCRTSGMPSHTIGQHEKKKKRGAKRSIVPQSCLALCRTPFPLPP